MSNRKREGKESEVLWNNIPMAAKKVRKDVLRNRKLNELCYRSSKLISLISSMTYCSELVTEARR